MAIRVHTSMSLDGFSTDAEGRPALLSMPGFVPGVSYGHAEFYAQCDAVVVGRTTFEPALSTPHWPWPGKKVFVLTSRPLPLRNDVYAADSAEAIVEQTRDLTGDVQLLGGPSMIRAFHAIDAIDRLEIVVVPVLLGNGIPLFPLGSGLERLTLEEQDRYDDGTVKLCYSTRG